MHYNTALCILSVPIVNEYGILKSGYRKYVFDGKYFVKKSLAGAHVSRVKNI